MNIYLNPGSSFLDPEYPFSLSKPSVRAARTGPASGQEWSAMECARALYRRKATLFWIACLGILIAMFISLIQPRIYQSQASIQIQGANENFLNLRDVYPTAAPSADNAVDVQTQVEMLQQDALIEQVVKRLRLDERRGFVSGSSSWDKLRSAGVGASWPTAATRTAVEEVKKNLQVVPSRGSSIIRIVYDAPEPQLAADLANTLAQTFIEQNIEARQKAAQQTHASLSRELDNLRQKLLKSEAELGVYGPGPGEIRGTERRQSAAGSVGSVWATPDSTLKREVAVNRQFFEAMSRRVDEAGIASAVRQSTVRLVGPAHPAPNPYKPNLPLNLAIGTFGGLVLAIGYVMLQEQTNSALRSPGEAGAYLMLPELGAIPKRVSGNSVALGLLGGSSGELPVERASLEQPLSGLSESFRGTLVSILSASHNGEHPHILVVTSSRPMEGKTTVVSNLGIALAEIGSKVLLIDGDLRRPRLHKVFDQSNTWGLSDMLGEKNAIEDLPLEVLVKKTAVPHLWLLPSGTCRDNIFGLLCSGRMARLFPRFRQEFDYVLVDAPPCLEFADARIMARYAEKLLLVVRADYTDRKTAQAAVQRLSLDGISVMGVIFNYWDPAYNDIYGDDAYCQGVA
jgi:polysaccharide biosynthesis transport protein